MQYGRAVDCLIREIVYADPALGYVYLLKADVSDGFYRIGLRPTYAPKLGLIFPSGKEKDQMVAIPLTLPMGWLPFALPFYRWGRSIPAWVHLLGGSLCGKTHRLHLP